ncbi:DUF3373 family protein [Sulfurospirillum diekertiae]|uniref:DUF3373 domain-containing protein n=1 Tax=Sulfurospirillum diekertiae TaxID=1854492 RepID=A0A1Y0HPQ7_9BACT|nr:DUF3373 family protein [Sulfurospirillum diekertiae]ARU50098.1 hypothetical protein Sdiek1_2956 [Sulfurospirillum diekertiae]ASC94886.1 hypothetical protein Sdiek2_2890 [Sulfurospirillum diekertiae]
MKKFIAPLLIGAALSSSAFAADDSLKQEVEALKAQMAELQSAQSKINIDALKAQVNEIKAHDAGDNIKFNVDFRTAYDAVSYKLNNAPDKDNGIWTNKLILGMASQPADNLVFQGKLGVYKAFGQNNIDQTSMFQAFDWYGTNKPGDDSIKLREAYFIYSNDISDVHYAVSFGRRPSLDGFMTDLRADNENPASPVGHNISMEFDGASFKFDFDKVTGISGLYFKICLGRGYSNTTGSYSMNSSGGFNPAYIEDSANPNMDLAGLLVQLYDNGQYKVMANYFKAWNMMDINPMTSNFNTGQIFFGDVGDMTGGSLSVQVNGIGDGISDFLDDSIFFLSYAFNQTDPKGVHFIPDGMGGGTMGTEMLGSSSKETGSSVYTGLQLPGIAKGQRLGLEYNHGSKYWRSYTYGEDTLAGSKLATRGDAYEIYYKLPIVNKNLTAQLSYVYMNYDYTGSNTFFGWTGTPMDPSTVPGAVKSASDVRVSLRYKY